MGTRRETEGGYGFQHDGYSCRGRKPKENFYYQYGQGALDQGQWERWCETLRVYFAQPGIREWFETIPQQFTASFAAFLDAECKRSHTP